MDLFKWQTIKQPKLKQLDNVLCKWFTALCCKGKPVTGHMIIETAKSSYDEMKITDKCTFSENRLKNLITVLQSSISDNAALVPNHGCKIKGLL
jgi:hypothetical protein